MKHIYMPFGNMKHALIPGKKIQGTGMGSVLLQRGGPGGASSYPSLDSYVEQTGRNPYAREARYDVEFKHRESKGLGRGLKAKIQALLPKPIKERKQKNISFQLG